MSNKKNLSPLAAAVGAAFLASASVSVSADTANPFAAEELSSGYNLAMLDDKMQEGSCGDKAKEGSCGDKAKEGSCGDKAKEGKCGGDSKKKEGKCGEGKCGA